MRVLHLINNLRREGAQIVVFNLVASSATASVQHAVCAREPGGALHPELEKRGISVFAPEEYHGVSATRRSLRFIDRIIGNEAIDIVHAHMADAAFLGWLAARKRNLPLIITHHGHDILPTCGFICRAVYALLLAVAARYAAANVAVAPSVANSVRRRLLLRMDRVTVVANGVVIPARQDRALDAPAGKSGPCIATVGRLVELKGQDQLISAASMLVPHYPGLRVLIVGDGPLRGRLEQLAKSLGVGTNVIFTGSVDDVPAYLSQAHIYVSTSHFEGMPIALLEAMAWQVPVIASDIPGNRGVIEHGKTGLLYPAGDARALAAALRQVIAEADLARERARRGRRWVEECRSAEATTRAYEQLYSRISRAGSPRLEARN